MNKITLIITLLLFAYFNLFPVKAQLFLANHGVGPSLIISLDSSIIISSSIIDIATAPPWKIYSGSIVFLDEDGSLIPETAISVREASRFKEGATRVLIGSLWWYLDQKGKAITSEGYRKTYDFSCNLAAVSNGERWGYINTEGQLAIEFAFGKKLKHLDVYNPINNYGEDGIGYFYKNTAPVSDSLNRWGLIDRFGNWVLSPEYDIIYNFQEDIAGFVKEGRLGYLNTKGEIIIKAEFDDLGVFTRPCKEGRVSIRKDGKWGFFNQRGFPITGFIFEKAWGFSEGIAVVIAEDSLQTSRYGIIDKTGAWVALPEFTKIINKPKQRLLIVEKANYMGVLDYKGRWIIEPIYQDINTQDGILFSVKKKGAWGVVNAKEEPIIAFDFAYLEALDGGLFSYSYNGIKYGVMDSDGKKITLPVFDEISYAHNSRIKVGIGGKFGIIDSSGKYIFHPTFANIDEIWDYRKNRDKIYYKLE